jgi:hypothetical protein
MHVSQPGLNFQVDATAPRGDSEDLGAHICAGVLPDALDQKERLVGQGALFDAQYEGDLTPAAFAATGDARCARSYEFSLIRGRLRDKLRLAARAQRITGSLVRAALPTQPPA